MMNKLYIWINVRKCKLWPLEGDGRSCGRKEKMISNTILIWLLFKKLVGIYRRCSKFIKFAKMHACRRFDDPGDEIHVESYGHLTWWRLVFYGLNVSPQKEIQRIQVEGSRWPIDCFASGNRTIRMCPIGLFSQNVAKMRNHSIMC